MPSLISQAGNDPYILKTNTAQHRLQAQILELNSRLKFQLQPCVVWSNSSHFSESQCPYLLNGEDNSFNKCSF